MYIKVCLILFQNFYLTYCFRDNLHAIETISQTDIKCVWSQQKHTTREKYKAVPVLDMPCLNNYTPTSYQVDVGMLRELYGNELPTGARKKHR